MSSVVVVVAFYLKTRPNHHGSVRLCITAMQIRPNISRKMEHQFTHVSNFLSKLRGGT